METPKTEIKQDELTRIDERRVARIPISREMLELLIGLPKEARVVSIVNSINQPGFSVELVIYHPEFESVIPGAYAPKLTPLFEASIVEVDGKQCQFIRIKDFGIKNGNGNASG